MSTCNNKVLLLIGGRSLMTEAVVSHFLEQGVGQVRAYSGDEEGLTVLRDRLQAADAEMAARVKYYVGDVYDPSYLAEAMDGVDFVVYETWNLKPETCEADPAEACIELLKPVNVSMDTAIQQSVKKLVVIGLDYAEPRFDTRSLIAALLEKVVVAQGRHQVKDDITTISYVRPSNKSLIELIDSVYACA